MTGRLALGAALLVAMILAASAGAVRVPPTSIVAMALARVGLTHGVPQWSATE